MNAHAQPHIAVSLAAHTNAGKTTLARTLLGRDVGIIEDGEHTTLVADSYTWLQSDQGDSLLLWDTPGFGDSQRLLKRLDVLPDALGWFLSETWDRLTDRGFYFSQRALRNVRDEADCVLYLINCAEDPELTGYLDDEMQLLRWLDKPVIIILNQYGDALDEQRLGMELNRWRTLIAARYEWVRCVLELDALSRCWIQEADLIEALINALPEHSAALLRLQQHWLTQQHGQLIDAMAIVAKVLLETATDDESVNATPAAWLRQAGAVEQARMALTRRLDERLKTACDQLVALYHIDIDEFTELSTQLEMRLQPGRGLDNTRSSLMGSVVSGILGGLSADVVSGGLSLGGGMLAGAVLGAAAGRLASAGINRVRGTRAPSLEWNPETLDALLPPLMMLYLAIAHCGRGRGPSPLIADSPRWQRAIQTSLAERPPAELELIAWRTRLRQDPSQYEAARTVIGGCLQGRLLDLLTSLHSPPESIMKSLRNFPVVSAQVDADRVKYSAG